MRKIAFTVEQERVSVKDYLKKQLAVSTRSIIELKNTENGMTVNGQLVRTVDELKKGDVLTLCVEEAPVIDESRLPFKILFQDENYVVLDKPPFTTVYKSGKEESNVNDILSALYPSLVFRPFYRLDKNTSGTLLLAKNALIMQGSDIEKYYFAVCHGLAPEKSEINEPISLEEGSVIKRRCGFGGQQALTAFERVAFDGENSLMKIKLFTGRTHQIRVHFSYMGHPLLGDDLYGGRQEKISRQALHCGVCRIKNTAINFDKTVISEFPADFSDSFGKNIQIKEIIGKE